jgi:hypothetical protein
MLKSPVVADTSRNTPCVFFFQVLDGLQLLVCSAVFPDTRFKGSMKSAASGACCQTMKTKHAEKTGARKDPLQISSYISSSCLSSPRVSSGKKTWMA